MQILQQSNVNNLESTNALHLEPFRRWCCCQHLHLADGDLVQPPQALVLGQTHVDQLCIHSFDIGQYKQLLHSSMVPHIPVEHGIGVTPLFSRQAEQGNVQHIRLVGVGDGGLYRCDRGWNQVDLDGIGMDSIVEFRQGPVKVPGQRQTAVLIFLEPLELLDQEQLELDGYPRGEFEGDVLMGKGTAVPAWLREQSYGIRSLDPLPRSKYKAVQTSLAFKPLEFEGFKMQVVQLLPYAQELDRVAVPHPVLDHVIGSFRLFALGDVRQGNIVLLFVRDDHDGCAFDGNDSFACLGHVTSCQ